MTRNLMNLFRIQYSVFILLNFSICSSLQTYKKIQPLYKKIQLISKNPKKYETTKEDKEK
jgi:hypothetical protein